MVLFCVFIFITIFIIFFVWQGKVLFKYIKCDNLHIDTSLHTISINNNIFNFNEIQNVTVDFIEEPNAVEKYFTRYAHFHTMYKVNFNMKDLTVNECILNSKGLVFNNLNKLKSHVRIDANMDEYKTSFVDGPTILGIVLVVLYFLFKYIGK